MGDLHPYFFLTCFDWSLPFCNFFRRFGNLVAGFLVIRLSFFPITWSPFNQRFSLAPSLDCGALTGNWTWG